MRAIDPRRKLVERSGTQTKLGIDGRSLGNGTAFSAVAPSQQPVCEAHRSNIREWYCPQARIADHLTFRPLVQFQPTPRVSVGPIRIVQVCGAFATYRPVSRASTSTICRCITGPDAACSRGREQHRVYYACGWQAFCPCVSRDAFARAQQLSRGPCALTGHDRSSRGNVAVTMWSGLGTSSGRKN
jgi:hypothetical protein